MPRLLDEANSIAQSCFPEVKRVTRTGPAPDHKPSILQDYELGRAMEIDVLVRAPAAFARAAGLSTPMLDLMAALAIRQARDKGLYGGEQRDAIECRCHQAAGEHCLARSSIRREDDEKHAGRDASCTSKARSASSREPRAASAKRWRAPMRRPARAASSSPTSRPRATGWRRSPATSTAWPVTADVGLEEDIKALIAAAEDKYGPVDVFFSNAGLSRKGQETASDADWDVSWRVHVMSHVFAARALVPGMLARGSGYLLNTASAAGLLASLNSMPYGVTKNAAVALAEHLAIQYGDRGIRVSVLCPQSVQTGMTTPGPSAARVDGVLQPPEVARMVIEAMEAERFLILSHPQVAEYMQRKASSRDRWLTGMRRLRDKIYGAPQQ